MGIYASYQRIAPDELQRLHKYPAAAAAYFGDDLEDEDEDGWDAYLESRNADDRHLDIQKTWDALHFLLTGSTSETVDNVPSPLQYVILGGTETEWETGYSNVRELTPQQVQEVSYVLRDISSADLRQRPEIEQLNTAHLYPDMTWDQEEIDYLLDMYEQLRAFYEKAAAKGDAMLLQLS